MRRFSIGLLLVVGLFFNCEKKNPTGAVTDINGNIYRTVKIGNQWWMAENLNVDNYRNGDPIPQIQSKKKWTTLTTGAYCYYDNDPAKSQVNGYGKLYNWYAINDPRGLAPEGWHVPKDSEWRILVDHLGGEKIAGDKIKEAGSTHWKSLNNTNATNESGFSALPSAYRDDKGSYLDIGLFAPYWTSTEYNKTEAWHWYVYYLESEAIRYSVNKHHGLSVRCVKD